MKRAFLYELKRNILPLCLFTAIATVLYVVAALSTDFIFSSETVDPLLNNKPINSLVYIPAMILGILCFLVSILQFSYLMKRTSTDLWYSLPIRREILLLTRLSVGLILVFVPYSVSYWAGFLVIALSENLFHLSYYGILFAVSLPIGCLLFFINVFLFTRANSIWDGILFIALGSVVLMLPAIILSQCCVNTDFGLENPTQYCIYSPLAFTFSTFNRLLLNRKPQIQGAVILYSLAVLEGIGSFLGLCLSARRHKAENAGQISNSPFGYKVLIPVYVFLFGMLLTVQPNKITTFFLYSMILLAAGLTLYFVYRRTFRLRWYDLVCLGSSLAGGLLIGALVGIFV